MRAQLLLDAEYEADMRKKDGGRYGAKTAEVNFDFSRNASQVAVGRHTNKQEFILVVTFDDGKQNIKLQSFI